MPGTRPWRSPGWRQQLGAEHLVTIPDLWRSDATEAVLEPRTLDDDQWQRLGKGHDQLGKALLEEFGVHQQFHTHADSHVGTYKETVRFLSVTDPQYTNLCLDTGHFAYYGGDNLKLIAEHPDRIGYLHLKQVDTDLLFDVLKNDVPFATAVAQGIMTEPPNGTPELAPVIEAVARDQPRGLRHRRTGHVRLLRRRPRADRRAHVPAHPRLDLGRSRVLTHRDPPHHCRSTA